MFFVMVVDRSVTGSSSSMLISEVNLQKCGHWFMRIRDLLQSIVGCVALTNHVQCRRRYSDVWNCEINFFDMILDGHV